jgi:hypothetical protein
MMPMNLPPAFRGSPTYELNPGNGMRAAPLGEVLSVAAAKSRSMSSPDIDREGSAERVKTCWRLPESSTRPMNATEVPVSSSASCRAWSATCDRSPAPAIAAEID